MVAEQQEKWRYLVFLNVVEKFIPWLLRMPKEKTYFLLLQKIMPDSMVYTDCLSSYDVLDVSGFTHHRINHGRLFADSQNHINSIENFWNQAKRVLRKYNGIDRKYFPLFLKEYGFRFTLYTV